MNNIVMLTFATFYRFKTLDGCRVQDSWSSTTVESSLILTKPLAHRVGWTEKIRRLEEHGCTVEIHVIHIIRDKVHRLTRLGIQNCSLIKFGN